MSIEYKVLKFDHKPKKLVTKSEGADTTSVYADGTPTFGPLGAQMQTLKLIISFKTAKVLKPGHVVQHNVVLSKEVKTTIELAAVPSASTAAQTNETTGYEEASAHKHIAGINAAKNRLLSAITCLISVFLILAC